MTVGRRGQRGVAGTPRVALDLTPLLGRPTGVGVFTSELVRGLVGTGGLDLVGYAATWRGRGLLAAVAPPGVRVATRPMPARRVRPPLRWITGPVDLVHGTNFVLPPAGRARRLVTVHDLTPLRFPELCSRDTLAYPRLIERAWRRGAWIHTVSRSVADEVRDWLRVRDADADRVVPIANGVTPVVGGDPAAGRALAGASRYVLAVGTIEPRKGLVDLVRALEPLARLDDPGRDAAERVRVVVAGPDGWGVDAFDAAVAASPQRDRIVRLGWVEDRARADLLAGATVLAYPSIYEGFGLPPLEAMSAGVPVVCSDRGPLPELTGSAAVRVPAEDPDALAEALASVLGDEGRRRALAAAGPAQAARYRWSDQVQAMAALYRRMLAVG